MNTSSKKNAHKSPSLTVYDRQTLIRFASGEYYILHANSPIAAVHQVELQVRDVVKIPGEPDNLGVIMYLTWIGRRELGEISVRVLTLDGRKITIPLAKVKKYVAVQPSKMHVIRNFVARTYFAQAEQLVP